MNKIHSREQEQQYQLELNSKQRRLVANLQILDLLKSYFLDNPDYRFGQGLYNLNIATHLACYDSPIGHYHKDIFFEESADLYNRLLPGNSDYTVWKAMYERDRLIEEENVPKKPLNIPTPIDKELSESIFALQNTGMVSHAAMLAHNDKSIAEGKGSTFNEIIYDPS